MQRLLSALVLIALVAAACDLAPTATLPPAGALGEPVRIDDVKLEGDRLVTLSFIGGAEFDPANPCSAAYHGSATVIDEELVVEVRKIERPPPAGDGPVLCTLQGYPRTVQVTLPVDFAGATIRDLAGYVQFLRTPPGLVSLQALPPEWALVSERDVEESPTGRWLRTYALDGAEDHRLDLYQSFGGPALVSGNGPQTRVDIGGVAGTLDRDPGSGELVLVWSLDGDGLALVAFERDFSADELVALAASATR